MVTPERASPTPAPPVRQGHKRHWLVVLGASCLMVAGMFMFLSASFLNPPLAEGLGTGLSQVMVFNSFMSVSSVIAMTFLAPVVFRRVGVRAVVVFGGVWIAVAMGAVSFVSSLAWLYVLGFAAGLLSGVATMVAATMLVNAWFQANRGTVLGAVFAVSGLGGISAGLVLPAVVSVGGWETGFRVIAGLALVLIVLPGIFLIRSHPADVGLLPFGAPAAADVRRPEAAADAEAAAEREDAAAGTQAAIETEAAAEREPAVEVQLPGVPAAMAFRTPQFAAFALAIVLFAGVQAMQQHFAPLMVERGVALASAGTLISLMALATVFSNVVVGTLNDRRGTRAAVMLALVCQVVSLVGYVFAVGFLPLAISTVVFAFAAALPGVLIPILVMLLFGMKDFATILGPSMALMPAGMALGTPLWGLSLDVSGSYTLALVTSAVLTVVVAALLVWAIRTAPALRSRVERELGQAYGAGPAP